MRLPLAFIYGVALTPEVQLIFYVWYFFTILRFYLLLKCEIFHRVWIFMLLNVSRTDDEMCFFFPLSPARRGC